MLFSERLEKFLTITNMGKQEFGKRAGISNSTLMKILRGEHVDIKTIELCQILMNKTLQELIVIAK